jgi:hypothetical protein
LNHLDLYIGICKLFQKKWQKMFKVIDNFLDEQYFKEIKDTISSFDFPWFYNDCISDKNDPKNYYYFIHFITLLVMLYLKCI